MEYNFKKEEAYKKLIKEQKLEQIKLLTELEIKKAVQDKTLKPVKVFISNLYKVNAWLTFEEVDQTDLNKLIDSFKPINCFISGGNSFRPTESGTEENKQINPYFIKYEGFNDSLKVCWFSKLNNYIVEIKAEIKDRDLINKFCSVTSDLEEFKGGFRISNTQIHLNGNFADGQYKTIRWARGTEQYKNDFTIYTENLETDFKDYLNT